MLTMTITTPAGSAPPACLLGTVVDRPPAGTLAERLATTTRLAPVYGLDVIRLLVTGDPPEGLVAPADLPAVYLSFVGLGVEAVKRGQQAASWYRALGTKLRAVDYLNEPVGRVDAAFFTTAAFAAYHAGVPMSVARPMLSLPRDSHPFPELGALAVDVDLHEYLCRNEVAARMYAGSSAISFLNCHVLSSYRGASSPTGKWQLRFTRGSAVGSLVLSMDGVEVYRLVGDAPQPALPLIVEGPTVAKTCTLQAVDGAFKNITLWADVATRSSEHYFAWSDDEWLRAALHPITPAAYEPVLQWWQSGAWAREVWGEDLPVRVHVLECGLNWFDAGQCGLAQAVAVLTQYAALSHLGVLALVWHWSAESADGTPTGQMLRWLADVRKGPRLDVAVEGCDLPLACCASTTGLLIGYVGPPRVVTINGVNIGEITHLFPRADVPVSGMTTWAWCGEDCETARSSAEVTDDGARVLLLPGLTFADLA